MLKNHSGIDTMYFKFKNHLKYILIGRDNIDNVKNIRNAYLTGPSCLKISFSFVLANKNGGTAKYKNIKIKPKNSLFIGLAGNP